MKFFGGKTCTPSHIYLIRNSCVMNSSYVNFCKAKLVCQLSLSLSIALSPSFHSLSFLCHFSLVSFPSPFSFLSDLSFLSPIPFLSLSLFLSLLCFHYGIYLTKKLSYLTAVSLDFMQFTILKNANFNVPVHVATISQKKYVATISQKKYVELLIAEEFTDFLCNTDVNFVSVVVSIKVPYHFNQ